MEGREENEIKIINKDRLKRNQSTKADIHSHVCLAREFTVCLVSATIMTACDETAANESLLCIFMTAELSE